MDRGWMETIGLLGVDIMFAAALAMLLAEQVRLVLRRVNARRRAVHETAGYAERGVGGHGPGAVPSPTTASTSAPGRCASGATTTDPAAAAADWRGDGLPAIGYGPQAAGYSPNCAQKSQRAVLTPSAILVAAESSTRWLSRSGSN